MKKLSEILELAMPSYVEVIQTRSRRGSAPMGNMCLRVADLVSIEEASLPFAEFEFAKVAIREKINNRAYLAEYLRSKGRKTTALAQIRFYQKWIKELKAAGL